MTIDAGVEPLYPRLMLDELALRQREQSDLPYQISYLRSALSGEAQPNRVPDGVLDLFLKMDGRRRVTLAVEANNLSLLEEDPVVRAIKWGNVVTKTYDPLGVVRFAGNLDRPTRTALVGVHANVLARSVQKVTRGTFKKVTDETGLQVFHSMVSAELLEQPMNVVAIINRALELTGKKKPKKKH
jgi:hypothetical protein